MTRWEYRHTPAAAPLTELNELGADGWEVVGQTDLVEHLSGGRLEDRVWLLRRTLQADPSVSLIDGRIDDALRRLADHITYQPADTAVTGD
jgi:hypothetical protein